MVIPELIKGYVCPNLEDCSKCKYYKTECIVYSKKGQAKVKEYKEFLRKQKSQREIN